MDILQIIKEYRKKRGYTQEQLGLKLSMAKSTYQSIESGGCKLNVFDFFKIIEILDIPLSAFSNEQLIVISKHDLESIEKHSRALYDITSKVKDQNSNSLGTTKNTNIQIGNNNSIHDSFNGK